MAYLTGGASTSVNLEDPKLNKDDVWKRLHALDQASVGANDKTAISTYFAPGNVKPQPKKVAHARARVVPGGACATVGAAGGGRPGPVEGEGRRGRPRVQPRVLDAPDVRR